MRIAGITIPDNKHLEIGLTEVYGVGRSQARKILEKVGVDPKTKAKDISSKDEGSLREEVEKLKIEGDLKRESSSNIKRLKDIGSYRGMRHSRSLPSRGQRTKTNSRTRRGNVRKTMGTGRRALTKT